MRSNGAAPASVAAIVLAAGLSRRMGAQHKLLLDICGEPMIRRVVRSVLAIAPVETMVVTGHCAVPVMDVLAGLDVAFAHNENFAAGQAGSVAAGVRALARRSDMVMIVPGDMPLLLPGDLQALVDAFGRIGADRSVLVPVRQGRRGNPVVFATGLRGEVGMNGVDVGCRRLIERHPEKVGTVEMQSDAYFTDCDTPEAYAAISRHYRLLETTRQCA